MWTMLVGMMTWFMMVGVLVFLCVWKTAFAAGFYFASRRNGMKTLHWTVSGLLFDIWMLIPYFYAKRKISERKCPKCEAPASLQAEFCTACGEKLERFDDGKIAVRFLLICVGGYVLFTVIGAILPLFVEM